MFVFLERDVRVKHEIPWYLQWLALDIATHKAPRSVCLASILTELNHLGISATTVGIQARAKLR